MIEDDLVGLIRAHLVAKGPTIEILEQPAPLEVLAQMRRRGEADVADDADLETGRLERAEAVFDAFGQREVHRLAGVDEVVDQLAVQLIGDFQVEDR